jgi:hypothetical protein
MRLLDDMERQAKKLAERASAYRMAGQGDLARFATAAACATALAVDAMQRFHAAEGEELNRQKEC